MPGTRIGGGGGWTLSMTVVKFNQVFGFLSDLFG
jgi:hypothetical protein